MAGCSRADGTQVVGKPVSRTNASVARSQIRPTVCPRLWRPTASATTDGQSPPPRALMMATSEKGPALGVVSMTAIPIPRRRDAHLTTTRRHLGIAAPQWASVSPLFYQWQPVRMFANRASKGLEQFEQEVGRLVYFALRLS